jgi:alanine racemase
MLREPAAQFDMVRSGIAIYGMDPFGEDPAARGLEPALELHSYVADVKRCRAGESAGYGRRFVAERDTVIALLPVGYGDGWRRNLTNNCDVLIGGARHPLVGTISMDSVTVDLGPDAGEELRGEPAVLIGLQGPGRITAEEIARRLGTINYEITCGLTARVSRVYHRDGAADAVSPAASGPGAT